MRPVTSARRVSALVLTVALAAYQEIHPLAPGWEDRVSLHQIAPLVVHAVKFGASYVPAATRAIETWS